MALPVITHALAKFRCVLTHYFVKNNGKLMRVSYAEQKLACMGGTCFTITAPRVACGGGLAH